MPTPVKKPANTATPLSVRVGLPVDGARLDVALGDVVRGRLRLPTDTAPIAAAFNLGSTVPATMPAQGYLIGGHAPRLDVSGWVQYVVGLSTGGSGPGLSALDVSADDGEVFGQHFANMRLVARPGPQALSLRVDSDAMVGQMTVPNDELRRRGITARMDRLWWPAAKEAATGASPWVPLQAVVRRAEMTGLYVLDAKGRPLLRQVRLGRNDGVNVEVLSGLSAGERVAIDAQAAARMTAAVAEPAR